MLPDLLRYRSPQHDLMKPSGSWGHGIGILATGVMLLNFVYPIRKRAQWLKRRGSIAPWLRFHVFVGILTPPVILFHSAFRWGNPLATATYVSLVVVVVTGLMGRFIYGLFRVDAEESKRAAELRARLQPVLAALGSLPGLQMDVERSAALAQLSALAQAPGPLPASVRELLFRMPADALEVASHDRSARALVRRPSGLPGVSRAADRPAAAGREAALPSRVQAADARLADFSRHALGGPPRSHRRAHLDQPAHRLQVALVVSRPMGKA